MKLTFPRFFLPCKVIFALQGLKGNKNNLERFSGCPPEPKRGWLFSAPKAGHIEAILQEFDPRCGSGPKCRVEGHLPPPTCAASPMPAQGAPPRILQKRQGGGGRGREGGGRGREGGGRAAAGGKGPTVALGGGGLKWKNLTSQEWSLGAFSDALSALQNKGRRVLARNCSGRASESLGHKKKAQAGTCR